MVKTKRRVNKRSLKNKSRTKKQKVWMMKGCSHSRSSKCRNCRVKKQRGGNCTACNNIKMMGGKMMVGKMMGGNHNPGNREPGPFIGNSWGTNVGGWPGVNGVGGDRNYLSQNLYKQDPQLMMKLGGRKYRGSKKRRGGGIIPQDLVNLGRDVSFNMGSTYNALAGYPQPVNPLPYKDQLTRSSSLII